MMRAPDLSRATGAYRIDLSYRPNLRAPRVAQVTVSRDGAPLERIDVDASRGYDVFAHTALYSSVYAQDLAPTAQVTL